MTRFATTPTAEISRGASSTASGATRPRNEDFNLSTAESTTVLELAGLIWTKIKGPEVPFNYVLDPGYEHDVQRRIPNTEKAERILGFKATTSLSEMLDEVIPWIEQAVREGRL